MFSERFGTLIIFRYIFEMHTLVIEWIVWPLTKESYQEMGSLFLQNVLNLGRQVFQGERFA